VRSRSTRRLWRSTPGSWRRGRGWARRRRSSTSTPRRRRLSRRARGRLPRRPSHALLGLSLAFLGRKGEAIPEARKAVELAPTSKDAHDGPYLLHQLARVYVLIGEHEKAIDTLEELLKLPYYVTKGWLRIDPNFDPLREEPRFVKLVGA
jgi:hypothetical protein